MKPKIIITLALVCAFCLFSGQRCKRKPTSPAGPNEPPVLSPPKFELPTTKLMLADQEYTVELAYTRASRAKGLMFREEIPPHTGMLFIHSESQELSYWMKNCLIDMDIVYIKEDGTIATTYTMTVLPDPNVSDWEITGYSSEVPVKYALEIAAGAAEKLGLTPGEKIEIPEKIKKIIAEPDF